MNNDNRGTISQQGNIMRIDNALVEEVSAPNRATGYLLVSYAVLKPKGMTSIQLLRLNIGRNTVILNSFGLSMCLCDIRKGMWIDSLFSPIMTRSIPPQSSAFLIVARRELKSSVSVTTDRIAMVDVNNNFLYTGNPNNINSQIRFALSNSTTISDRNGNPVSLRSLRPGQMVRVTHANFQTASIPPQTTAFHVQLL
ncbi:hypothetical protein C8E03_11654 [Lachnotalea glycerini]|uniref:BBRPI n=1 Tax=Lachnotalea glycerini TaxID=1763509 RepID=A0A318EH82_9FIRM|nr:hypothetical protein [Lachnotalea glycerini]OYP57947.1 hypothetical protein CG709_00750 [Lachnotalea glycerini]PXV85620.1 hypothetical protein C8E03_11654 [Lachnotalea glycerini]